MPFLKKWEASSLFVGEQNVFNVKFPQGVSSWRVVVNSNGGFFFLISVGEGPLQKVAKQSSRGPW